MGREGEKTMKLVKKGTNVGDIATTIIFIVLILGVVLGVISWQIGGFGCYWVYGIMLTCDAARLKADTPELQRTRVLKFLAAILFLTFGIIILSFQGIIN